MDKTNQDMSNSDSYKMRLFVVNHEHNSVTAENNLREICKIHLPDNFEIKVLDIFENFTEAIEENIIVTPALIIYQPRKIKIYGNLQDHDKVLQALGLK